VPSTTSAAAAVQALPGSCACQITVAAGVSTEKHCHCCMSSTLASASLIFLVNTYSSALLRVCNVLPTATATGTARHAVPGLHQALAAAAEPQQGCATTACLSTHMQQQRQLCALLSTQFARSAAALQWHSSTSSSIGSSQLQPPWQHHQHWRSCQAPLAAAVGPCGTAAAAATCSHCRQQQCG
jgi:hypothetical protein